MVRSVQKSDAEPIIVRLVEIISQWKKIEEPYIKWRPLKQITEKEQAEVDKLKADAESVKASTYHAYINAGIMEPYEARFLEFGDTLDKIPVPEDLLPQVETVPEGEGNNPDDEPGETETRIAELEEKEKLTDEEQKELDELKKQLEEAKTDKPKKKGAA
jgi:hypothetical protein